MKLLGLQAYEVSGSKILEWQKSVRTTNGAVFGHESIKSPLPLKEQEYT